jgi:acetyl-CoA carboxylase biotin carboxyl carrier protein
MLQPRADAEPSALATILPPATDDTPHAEETHLPEVLAHITGTVWKIEVEVGNNIEEGDTVVVLESMKMEMPVEAEDPGVVTEILCEEGQSVSEGDPLVVLQ